MTVIELATACVAVLGALGICMSKSRCDTIETPCLKIHRQVLNTELEMTPNDDSVVSPPPPILGRSTPRPSGLST